MRRLISLAILLIYVNMLIGCTKQVTLHRSEILPQEYNKIIAVVKADSDQDINFDDNGGQFNCWSKFIEGRTVDGETVSYNADSLQFVIVEIIEGDSTFVKRYNSNEFVSTYRKQAQNSFFKKILAVTLINGKDVKFNLAGAKISLDKQIVYGDNESWLPVEISMDSVAYARVIKDDIPKTVILASLGLLVVWKVYDMIEKGLAKVGSQGSTSYPKQSSCPLVYSYTGDDYILDAQPLSGALCPAMKRSKISALENIIPVDGEYRLMIKNVLHETEYLDNISLFYIDHPEDHRVVYDADEHSYHLGEIHEPVLATDESGHDVSTYMKESDGVAWRSLMPVDTLKPPEIDRHQLIFKFLKPQDAESGILVYNAGTSFWASRMVREFLQLKGSLLPEWLDSLEKDQHEMIKLQNLLKRDESYLLQVEVGEDDEFQPQGYIRYGGPLAIEDRAMRLDLGRLEGDTVTIRLNPPFGFWTVDYIGMAWDEYEMPETHYVEFVSAIDNDNLDIRSLLESRDDVYHKMPNTGDYFDAMFKSPDTKAEPGFKRSVFIQMSGYYSLHFDLTAAPQTDRLEYLENTPGAAIELSMEEYMKCLSAAYQKP